VKLFLKPSGISVHPELGVYTVWKIDFEYENFKIVQSNLKFTDDPVHEIQNFDSEKLHFEQEIKKFKQ